MNAPDPNPDAAPLLGTHSRRAFLKGFGAITISAAASQTQAVAEELSKLNAEKIVGPGPVPVTLRVNGETLSLSLEPRVTLLDALRNVSTYTGTKEGCDRATCGACTVLLDGAPIYACQMLAIEAQGHAITTVEGLAQDGKLTPVQKAFAERDATMCGYCTPGFVMAATALLKENPHPTPADVRRACSGNLCRCGTQPRVVEAVLQAAGGAAENGIPGDLHA